LESLTATVAPASGPRLSVDPPGVPTSVTTPRTEAVRIRRRSRLLAVTVVPARTVTFVVPAQKPLNDPTIATDADGTAVVDVVVDAPPPTGSWNGTRGKVYDPSAAVNTGSHSSGSGSRQLPFVTATPAMGCCVS
jgi:hypothetical protein